MQQPQPQESRPMGIQTSRRIAAMKAHEFDVIKRFPIGYRNREDKTALPPGTLIVGSQNVLVDVTGRINITKGYTLDGDASVVEAPILSSFDWQTHVGTTRHLRAGFLTSSNGKLQYRYESSTGVITWRDLMTSLTSVNFNFTDYWDSTTFQAYLLFVNGTSNIYEWSGGITEISSVGTNTLTKQGATTWAEIGFYNTGTRKVTISGIDYTYTGGESTTTLTGVTPDPALAVVPIVSGDIAHQTVRTTANSAMTDIPSTFTNSLIANLRNQIYIGSLVSNQAYVSKVNDYKVYTFTSPVRIVGEGAIITFDATPTAFIPQEEAMYISAGKDQWYQTKFTLSSDLTKEEFTVNRLKTSELQGTQSQALTSKIQNSVVYVSNEPILNTLGRVDNVVSTPQINDISFPIVNDFNSYNFTNGSVFYHKKFIYVAVPEEGLVRIYNMSNTVNNSQSITSSTNFYWEAPLVIPISRFSSIDGELYGHSYLTSETYKMFNGYNFNGGPIPAVAKFAYMNQDLPGESKSFNEFFIEGYISANTTLNLGIDYDLDGYAGSKAFEISGSDTSIVQVVIPPASLGKKSLGKSSLGGSEDINLLPPKFRVIKTTTRTPFYEYSPSFSSSSIDYNWSILRFGSNVSPTSEGNNPITQ